jgi:colanic acid biosynthesis glycosyl transferase WcaI
MKILIVNQFFWPDVAATGQLLTDLARYLGPHHDVTVICSGGAYAETQSMADQPPVRIVRVPGARFNRSAFGRFISYGTFLAGAILCAIRAPRQDLIVTMTTPPLTAVGGTMLKALRGTRHYIWEMDVFPDVFVSLGALSERGLVTRLLGGIEKFCRKRCDGIIALGPCMRKKLIEHGTPERLIHVVENWADGTKIRASPHRFTGPLNVFYSGNLGLSHDVDTILGAIRHFRNDPRYIFTFAGGGVGKTTLENISAAEKLDNVRFLPYSDPDQMNRHLALADIGLVTQKAATIGTVVPSKVYGLAAAGRPVLFIGPREATPSLLVSRADCGWQTDPGDVASLVGLLEWLSANRSAVAMAGARARAVFDRYYDLPLGVANIAAALGLSTSQVQGDSLAGSTREVLQERAFHTSSL